MNLRLDVLLSTVDDELGDEIVYMDSSPMAAMSTDQQPPAPIRNYCRRWGKTLTMTVQSLANCRSQASSSAGEDEEEEDSE
ncbi:hypothetical protein SAY87_001350 [Trapa incisa]|uniref:Uncharacterized protein n=1 Tax=Trapa incisa TaxID=236973 RepID=A0AAN7JGW5_9MYRT|nr:hypothetical protein SAY87_001350 [Trapa incisa]